MNRVNEEADTSTNEIGNLATPGGAPNAADTASATQPSLPSITPLVAATHLFSVLTQVAGVAVVFTALAYVAGSLQATTYYRALGAPWFSSLLPLNRIIDISANVLIPIGLGAIFALLGTHEKPGGAQFLNRASNIAGILMIAAMFAGVVFYLAKWIPHADDWLLELTGLCAAVVSGLLWGHLIFLLALRNLKWGTTHIVIAMMIASCGWFLTPLFIGEAQARRDIDPQLTPFPLVVLKGDQPTGNWRMAAALDSQTLLVELGASRQYRRFRLVANGDISSIQAGPLK
jgi:hypothetical protein